MNNETSHTGLIAGLHHLTAITADAQANIDFYSGVLGLRLVKRTVNFDDPSAHHLYYGDGTGSPGTILTFFNWAGASRGRVGRGQVTAISLSVPAGSLNFWIARLAGAGVTAGARSRFGENVVEFADPDGIPVELVEASGDPRTGWTGADVPAESAIRGMHTAVLTVGDAGRTGELLTGIMGYRLVRRDGNRARYESATGVAGRLVDLIADVGGRPGSGAAGTIHHIAFRVAGDEEQLVMQEALAEAGYGVSDVRDRDYFHSIYYREPGGILFEIATDVPGFAVDEPVETLGTALKLPAWLEPSRARIERLLVPIHAAGALRSAPQAGAPGLPGTSTALSPAAASASVFASITPAEPPAPTATASGVPAASTNQS